MRPWLVSTAATRCISVSSLVFLPSSTFISHLPEYYRLSHTWSNDQAGQSVLESEVSQQVGDSQFWDLVWQRQNSGQQSKQFEWRWSHGRWQWLSLRFRIWIVKVGESWGEGEHEEEKSIISFIKRQTSKHEVYYTDNDIGTGIMTGRERPKDGQKNSVAGKRQKQLSEWGTSWESNHSEGTLIFFHECWRISPNILQIRIRAGSKTGQVWAWMLRPGDSSSRDTDSETRKMAVLKEGKNDYFYFFLKNILSSKVT